MNQSLLLNPLRIQIYEEHPAHSRPYLGTFKCLTRIVFPVILTNDDLRSNLSHALLTHAQTHLKDNNSGQKRGFSLLG